MNQPPSVLSFSRIKKKYNNLIALNDVSFEIPNKSVFAILGPNGSGKSTLIKILAGLITSWDGNIFYRGNSIKNKNKYLRNFGFIIETPSFYEFLSAKKNLEIFSRLTETPMVRITEVLDLVGLLDRQFDRVSSFSYGMKQRLGIAQTLLHNPSVLVLDEPNNGLDPIGITKMADTIYKLNHAGKTICISTHSLNEVDRLCSNVAILKKGKLIVTKHIKSGLKTKIFYRLETTNNEKALKAINGVNGTNILSNQNSTIIFSHKNNKTSILDNNTIKNLECIRSIHIESDLIEYFYS